MSQVADAVFAEVTAKVKGANDEVKARVIAARVEKELVRRTDLLESSIAKLTEFKKTLDRMRPDVETFNGDGVKAESFSKAKWEERKKIEEKMAKLGAAVDGAITGGDFAKLDEVLKKSGSDNKNANE